MGEPIIELKDLTLHKDNIDIIKNINLKIYSNEFITLLGPSGCGKSTTLRIIAGLEKPTSGELIIEGKVFNDIPPYCRPLNTVFQKYALFPNMNVINNVMVGLKSRPYKYLLEFFGGKGQLENELKEKNIKANFFSLRKLINQKIEESARKCIKLVKLEGYEERRIDSLSGGQQQRIAIARAVVNRPKILLLDEPLAALDLKLRENMQYELKEMQRHLGITFIFVTHDQTEAMTMSDRIVVMNEGEIQQIGDAKSIYDLPVNNFVANFVGESNVFKGVYHIKDSKASVTFLGKDFDCDLYKGFEDGEAVNVVIRPEDFILTDKEHGQIVSLCKTCVFKGVSFEVCTDIANKEVVINTPVEAKPGEEIYLTVKPVEIHIMKI